MTKKPTNQLVREALDRARLREVLEATENPSERLYDTIQRLAHNLNELRACQPYPDEPSPLIERMEALVLEAITLAETLLPKK